MLLIPMNYNQPVHEQCADLFRRHSDIAGRQGPRDQSSGKSQHAAQTGRRTVPDRSKPYQYIVDQKKAALAEAEQNVKQLKASLDQATAAADKANAQLALAQQTYERQSTLLQKNVVAQATVDTATRNLEAARQSVTGARAEEERSRLAYSSNVDGVNTTVARLQAELADANMTSIRP